MFKDHLKIARRTLLKDKQFTFLNVLGLSAGWGFFDCQYISYSYYGIDNQFSGYQSGHCEPSEIVKNGMISSMVNGES